MTLFRIIVIGSGSSVSRAMLNKVARALAEQAK
jgi:hypothetical protein